MHVPNIINGFLFVQNLKEEQSKHTGHYFTYQYDIFERIHKVVSENNNGFCMVKLNQIIFIRSLRVAVKIIRPIFLCF